MQGRLFTLMFVLISVMLTAQPTATRDWLGDPGDIIASVATTSIPEINPGGANAIWDFSELVNDTFPTVVQIYGNADTSQFADDFPGANMVLFSQFSDKDLGTVRSYAYFELTDDQYTEHGHAFNTNLGDIKEINDDLNTMMMFPFTYESEFEDSYSSIFDLGVATRFSEGRATVTADGYGSIALPGGTVFDNVLRIRTVADEVDSTDLGAGFMEKVISTRVTHFWLSGEHPGPLAVHEYTESYQIGIVPPLPPDTTATMYDTAFYYDPTAVSSSLRFYNPKAYGFAINPNPFTDQLALQFTLERQEDLVFELQTVAGQVVLQRELKGVAGENITAIEARGFEPGAYLAVLRGKQSAAIKMIIKKE